MDEIKRLTHYHKMLILAVSKTWLTGDISDGTVCSDAIAKADPGGGVCIYVHHSLQVQLLPVTNANLKMLRLKFRFGKQVYITVCLYRPQIHQFNTGPIWTLRWKVLKAKKLFCWMI